MRLRYFATFPAASVHRGTLCKVDAIEKSLRQLEALQAQD